MKTLVLSVSIVLALLLALFASCGQDVKPQEPGIVSDVNVRDASEAELRTLIEQAAGQAAADFRYDDFDGDGTSEAFAFTPSNNSEYRLWYAKNNMFTELENDGYLYEIQFVDLETQKWLICELSAGGSSSWCHVWTVRGGIPEMLPNSATGNPEHPGGLRQADGNDFYFTGEDFDINFIYYEGSWMGTGHTYKRYYLYWTENGFKEYGGIALSENKLSEYTGAREVLASIRQKGGRITEIYYRANGIINVNYRYNEASYSYDCANVTLKVSGNSVSLVENIDCGGAFKAAFFPSIATYPKIGDAL